MIQTVKIPSFGQQLLCLCGLLVFPLSKGLAETPANFQPLETIRSTAEAYILARTDAANTTVTVGTLDPRLRLHHCTQALQAFMPPGARTVANTTVGVRCVDQKPWKIYVPVHVEVFKDVLVANYPLSRGRILKESDLSLERRGITRHAQGHEAELESFIGYKLKRSMRAGEMITSRMVEAEKLIKRGQDVHLVVSVRGLKVRMAGKALSDGAAGQTIKVRSLSSKRIIEGQVTDRGTVTVRL